MLYASAYAVCIWRIPVSDGAHGIACRYYDHGKGWNVKGVNILTAFYLSENEYGKLQTPIDYQIISKTKTDGKSGIYSCSFA
jgi:hypothetical protein